MHSRSRILLLLSLFVASPPSHAGEAAIAAGAFDVLHHVRSADLRAEYQADTSWGGLGVALPIDPGDSWLLRPSGLVGLYTRGNDKRLGAAIEFRPGIELAYRFVGGTLGIEFSHYSNAGLTTENPGAESLVLRWAWRL